MNVVHAGLELVLMDLKRIDEELGDRLRDTVELVEDIFAASDSAITILNDLLNYEHLDSGAKPIVLRSVYFYVNFIRKLQVGYELQAAAESI